MSNLTLLIAAHNAAATIERAITSALGESGVPIVLADDRCTDLTVPRARALAGARLQVIAAPKPGVSAARQAALAAVETEFAAWLDADDEWMPGRAERLLSILGGGCDIATEAIDLYDGPSSVWLKRLAVPGFLRRAGGTVRLFERNFLPGDTQVAFRVATYQSTGGYDPNAGGPESFDVLLRAIRRGARIGYGDDAGYRMYAYPGSVSRDITRQNSALAAVLKKHAYRDVREMYLASGHDPRIAAWGLVSMATFRRDPKAALRFLEDASPKSVNPDAVLEPEGPWPFGEGWRRAFHRGTLLLMIGGRDREAAMEFHQAEAIDATPEGANNLGIALWRLGHKKEASVQFMAAMDRKSRYYDAAINGSAEIPVHITTHPLRRAPSRSDYAVPVARAS